MNVLRAVSETLLCTSAFFLCAERVKADLIAQQVPKNLHLGVRRALLRGRGILVQPARDIFHLP